MPATTREKAPYSRVSPYPALGSLGKGKQAPAAAPTSAPRERYVGELSRELEESIRNMDPQTMRRDTASENGDVKAKRKESSGTKVVIGDDKLTARFAQCENCEKSFDLTLNQRGDCRGDCRWHPKGLEVKTKAKIWERHDEKARGDDKGCKLTKHKNAANEPMESLSGEDMTIDDKDETGEKNEEDENDINHEADENAKDEKDGQHVEIEEDETERVWNLCVNCGNDFEATDEDREDYSSSHGGERVVDPDSSLWGITFGDMYKDREDTFNDEPEDFMNDPEYEEGFMWDRCGRRLSSEKCLKRKLKDK